MDSEITSRIRSAVASGEYEEALRLWNEYAGLLRNDLAAGALTGSALADAGQLLAWSRETVLCARAHMLDCMNGAYVARIYAAEPSAVCGCSRASR